MPYCLRLLLQNMHRQPSLNVHLFKTQYSFDSVQLYASEKVDRECKLNVLGDDFLSTSNNYMYSILGNVAAQVNYVSHEWLDTFKETIQQTTTRPFHSCVPSYLAEEYM